MTDDLPYRPDLYRGTAPDYDRFRRPYPAGLLDDLRHRTAVDGSGRLLDLACGTGQIALALAGSFAGVVAVDQEPESVDFARRKAEGQGVSTIDWLAARAEDVDVDGPFDLVTVGNAFHRLKRQVVAERARSWLVPGGHLAVLWVAPRGEATGPGSGPCRWPWTNGGTESAPPTAFRRAGRRRRTGIRPLRS